MNTFLYLFLIFCIANVNIFVFWPMFTIQGHRQCEQFLRQLRIFSFPQRDSLSTCVRRGSTRAVSVQHHDAVCVAPSLSCDRICGCTRATPLEAQIELVMWRACSIMMWGCPLWVHVQCGYFLSYLSLVIMSALSRCLTQKLFENWAVNGWERPCDLFDPIFADSLTCLHHVYTNSHFRVQPVSYH